MKYYKNVDIAERLGVSTATVTNWLNSAREGKANLELVEIKGRQFIAKTFANEEEMKKMVEKGRVHRAKSAKKIVNPLPEFYEVFTTEQKSEIITEIEIDREIPHKYSYFSRGAQIWYA